jgi:hypothetical protein
MKLEEVNTRTKEAVDSCTSPDCFPGQDRRLREKDSGN